MKKLNLKTLMVSLAASAAALVSISAANAHHNYVSHYDMSEPRVTVEGTVDSFWFVNPHIRIYINKTNEETGENEVWIAEGRSRNILAREGWAGDEIQKGDAIRIEGTPARSEAMRTHVLLGGGIRVNGEMVNAGALEHKVKDFQLGGEGAATSNSHLEDGAREPGGAMGGMGGQQGGQQQDD